MKKIFIINMFFFGALNSFSQTYFEKVINPGSSGAINEGFSVQQTSDNNYIIAAGGFDNVSLSDFSYLIKTDSIGNVLWTNAYSSNVASGQWALETKEGDYVLLSEESFINPLDIFLRKYTSGGSQIWQKNYFFNNDTINQQFYYNRPFYLSQTSDSGFVITGHKAHGGIPKLYVIKTKKDGDTCWRKVILDSISTTGYCIKQTPDEGYIISTGYDQNSPNNNSMYVVKLTKSGNVEWYRSFIYASVFPGNSIELTSDSGFVIAGAKLNTNNLFLVKMNKNGDTIWTKTYPLPPASSIRIINDSTYLMVSNLSVNNYIKHILLIKTDSNGNIKDTSAYSSMDPYCSANCLSLTNDNSCCFVGSIYASHRHIYLVKTGNLIQPLSIKTFVQNDIIIYPNPTSDYLTIELKEDFSKSEIKIFNLLGELEYSSVRAEKIKNIDISNFARGMYFIKVTTEKEIITKKFIKE